MADTIHIPQYSFASGEWSPRLHDRSDLQRFSVSARTLKNWQPLIQGGIDRRPGTRFVGPLAAHDVKARVIPFVFDRTTAYALAFGDRTVRFFRNQAPLMVPDNTATVTNGTFDAGIAGWTDLSTGTAEIRHDSEAGRLVLAGATGETAHAEQAVSVGAGMVHVLAFETAQGPVTFRVGSTSGADDVVSDIVLGRGTHVFGFTAPSSTVHLQFLQASGLDRMIGRVRFVPGGPLDLDTPYAPDALFDLVTDQSADVMYIAVEGSLYAPRTLKRRGDLAWSLEITDFVDGPYLPENTTDTTITPSALFGVVTLTASAPVFTPDHVEALWRLRHAGRAASVSGLSGPGETAAIEVSGVGDEREITVAIDGLSGDTIVLERSTDGGLSYAVAATYTTSGTRTFKDGLTDTLLYRARISVYGAGLIDLSLAVEFGFTDGYARIIQVNSASEALAEVQRPFAKAVATKAWREGAWSAERGFPGVVELHEQAAWYASAQTQTRKAQADTVWRSRIGLFTDFTPGIEDDDPLSYALANERVDAIEWMISAEALMIGTRGGEWVGRASALQESITPANFNARESTTAGGRKVRPVKEARRGLFVQRAGRKLIELAFQASADGLATRDLTEIAEHITGPGLVDMAFQREPGQTVYCVRADGRLACLVYRREQDLIAWWTLETKGQIESVAVLPGQGCDEVWMTVRRTVNSHTRCFVEVMTCNDDWRRKGSFGTPDGAFFVDAGLSLSPDEPNASLTPGAVSGDAVTFASSAAIFGDGDLGKIIRINGGKAEITAQTGSSVTGRILVPLRSLALAQPGEWTLGTRTTILTGLDHLEGERVQIWADGAPHPDQVVSGGSVGLERAASQVHAGLGFDSVLVMNKVVDGGRSGSVTGQRKRIGHAVLTLVESVPPRVGASVATAEDLPFRTPDDPLGYAPALRTGVIDGPLSGNDYTDDPRLVVLEDRPGPCLITSVHRQVEVHQR
ncbi:MAG: hypothetical protein ACFB6R_14500 [Alphaproteobacteria bacterium]